MSMRNENRNRPTTPSAPRLAVAIVVGVLAIIGLRSPAWAGGWAISTLDEVPTPVPGTPVNVGFTIRQHGVTPVDLTEGVGIEITAADGKVSWYPAAGDGVPGHYVASVTFPTEGEYTWSTRQGWFAAHDLGTIAVGPAQPAARAGDGDSMPWLRYGLLGATLGLGLFAILDAVASRRRRVTPA